MTNKVTEAILKLPRRVEPISGQNFSYVKLDDVLALLEQAALSLKEAEAVGELPDDLRIPLFSLKADVAYLIGRVAEDADIRAVVVESIDTRLSQIETACYAALAAPVTTQAEAREAGIRAALTIVEERYDDSRSCDQYLGKPVVEILLMGIRDDLRALLTKGEARS